MSGRRPAGRREPLPLDEATLDELIERATVDCYGEDEELSCLYDTLTEELHLPFETIVLGATVLVESIELADRAIVALCSQDRHRQRIDLADVPIPVPPPEGWEWIKAYRRWVRPG